MNVIIEKTILLETNRNDKVPLFRKWGHWYALVIGFLVALIFFFYFFTKYFS